MIFSTKTTLNLHQKLFTRMIIVVRCTRLRSPVRRRSRMARSHDPDRVVTLTLTSTPETEFAKNSLEVRKKVTPDHPTIYLVQRHSSQRRHRRLRRPHGILVCYLVTLPQGWHSLSARNFWILDGLMFVLLAAELPFAHVDAFVMGAFIVVVSIAHLGAGPPRSSSS